MSNSAPPPVSNGASNASPPSPSNQINQAAPPPDLTSVSLVSPPPLPDSTSNATSQLPVQPKQGDSPPPSLPPPAPPPDNNPPPSPPQSSSASPEPPQTSNESPPLPAQPPQPSSPPNEPPPTSQGSLPTPPPPVTPAAAKETPSPPTDGTQSFSPPSEVLSPPAAPDTSVSPDTAQTPPISSMTPPSTPTTPAKATPTTNPSPNLPTGISQSTPPPSRTSSSTSSQTTKTPSDGPGSGTIAGVTFAGVFIVLVAIIFVTLRKKKRRMNTLVNPYAPHATFSVKSDGYYRQVNQVGNSNHFDSYYGSRTPFYSSDMGRTTGSNRGYASHNGSTESGGIGSSKSWFTYEEIADMTHGFSRENLLGEGGFGCVYKGWLPDGKVVAVKQLKAGSGQGEREFRAEVEIISRVHHRHLVSLVGYCIADNQRSLVYEFVPNDTLEHHLHAKGLPVLDWPRRLKIAIGSARGLAYLHEDCHPRIIHRDIKSANILLDSSFEAQVADFGLAKLSNDMNTHVSTRVMGTFGYMAPEYASSGKLTDRSDVFSFGVVLLELITGRKPVDPSQPLGDESLVEWARPRLVHALETEDLEELADPRLENNYAKSEMFRMIEVAAACVRHSAPKRPRMVQVLRALDSEGDLPDLSNGVRFGQSTVFESGQYSADIRQFRRMAFGSGEFGSDSGTSGELGGEHSSAEAPHRPMNPRRPGHGGGEPWESGRRGGERGTGGGSRRFNGQPYF